MIHKTIFRTLLIAAATAVTSSCTFEQEDFFDESASLRITHTNQKIQNRLVEQSASNHYGWVIQYFVGGTDEWQGPGFNLLGRFSDNGSVTLASNHRYLRNGQANKYTEATSIYEMLAEEGPVLSFNTWNDVLTVLADPVDPTQAPNSLINDGEGMNGDYNFVLKALNDEDIIFRGERHSAPIRFVPCDRPWEDYLADTDALKAYITSTLIQNYYVVNETADTLYFSYLREGSKGLRNGRFYYCERLDDPLSVTEVACVFTPQGFRTETQQTFGDNVFQEFTLSEDSTCLVNENGTVKVMAIWDTYIADFTNHPALWKLDAEYFTAEQQALYEQIGAELKKYSSNYDIEGLYLGQSTAGNKVTGLIVRFYTNARHTNVNTAGIELNIQRTAFGQMAVNYSADSTIDQNMKAIGGKTNLEESSRQFAATLGGVYNMVPNNYFLPTGGVFTPTEGGTAFKLD